MEPGLGGSHSVRAGEGDADVGAVGVRVDMRAGEKPAGFALNAVLVMCLNMMGVNLVRSRSFLFVYEEEAGACRLRPGILLGPNVMHRVMHSPLTALCVETQFFDKSLLHVHSVISCITWGKTRGSTPQQQPVACKLLYPSVLSNLFGKIAAARSGIRMILMST